MTALQRLELRAMNSDIELLSGAPDAARRLRRAEWWLGAALVAVACLPFGSLWLDWLAVIRNSPFGLAYSVASLPWLAVPIVAWAARSRPLPSSRLIGATSTTS